MKRLLTFCNALFPGFGATPAPSAFGAPAPSTGGLFGAPAPATSSYGLAPAPPAGLFGSPAPAPSTGTTATTPYQPTTRQDGSTSITLQNISAMPVFENQSPEELRYKDYIAAAGHLG